MMLYIIILPIGIIFLTVGIFCLIKANKITTAKSEDNQKYHQQIINLQNSINELKDKKLILFNEIEERKKSINQEYEYEKEKIQNEIALYKKNTDYASEQYINTLEKQYIKAEQEYDKKIKAINIEQKEIEDALQKLRETLTAGVQAQLREKEKEEQIDFYRIVISDNDLSDIASLNQIKLTFHQPVVLNKLIWSTYFQKKVTEMCNRILGTEVVCGIYKITNLKTKQCYIGQSVNVADRWKQHCKCGCGIEASATNKLYQDMIKTGIWNFSFELMEACDRDQLNEKERFWINLYQSDIYGLNSTKGNK